MNITFDRCADSGILLRIIPGQRSCNDAFYKLEEDSDYIEVFSSIKTCKFNYLDDNKRKISFI